MHNLSDHAINQLVQKEALRQNQTIQLIASENFVSKNILSVAGSILTNKYAEGLPGKRYYGGCEDVDAIETLAIERAKILFGADWVNVQPHSGSSANLAVFNALLKPGDLIMGMDLSAGGHLTHGHPVNFSGKTYRSVHYGVDANGHIDYEACRALALTHKPKLIIAGFSAYSQVIDWQVFQQIAKEVGAYFMADMAHVSGLVAASAYPSPIPYADVVTTTTHKTLRGPRGGMILAKASSLTKKLDKAVFPGTQGGPLMHIIGAKAVCFHEAMQEDFKVYIQQVVKNTIVMASVFQEAGLTVVSGKPACHMFLLSLENIGMTGDQAQTLLEQAGIVVNKNSIPNDPLPPNKTSGIRIGSQAMTTRGMDTIGARQVATWMLTVLNDPSQIVAVKAQVLAYCDTLQPVE